MCDRVPRQPNRRDRIILLGCLLLGCLLLVVGGCGDAVIRVGFVADLSGRGSGSGIAARNGAMLAVANVNARGGINGKRIVLHIKDDKGLGAQSVAVDRELVAAGTVLVIGHLNSGPGLEGVQVLLDAGIPVVSPAMGTKKLSGLDDGFFRVIPESLGQGRVLAREILAQTSQNARVAMLLEENNLAYCEDVAEGFRKEWEADGRSLSAVNTYRTGKTVAFDQITGALLENEAEVYLIMTGGLDLAVFTQKVRMRQPTAIIASGMWGMTHDFLQNAGSASEGVLFPQLYSPTSTAPAWQAFVTQYREEFSIDPLFSSGTAYEAVMVASEAIGQAKSLKGEAIRAALLAHGPFEGLQESFQFDAYGDCQRAYQIVTVRDGRFAEVLP